jgi:hypothetical protein
MILYNVTVNVEENTQPEWLQWMKKEHIPEVMATGKFVDWKIYKILNRQADETGITYSIQYFAKNIEDYNDYQRDFAPALQLQTLQRYGEKIMAFRTLLETV